MTIESNNEGKTKRKNNFLSIMFFGMLIMAIIVSISSIFSARYLLLLFNNILNISTNDLNSIVLSMQANTLTITAITISVALLILTVATTYQSRKTSDVESKLIDQLEEAKTATAKAEIELENISMLSQLAFFNLLDEFSKEKLIKQQLYQTKENKEESYAILFSLSKHYLDVSSKRDSDFEKETDLRKAISYADKTIKIVNNDIISYLSYMIIGEAYFELSKLHIYEIKNDRSEYIEHALENFKRALDYNPDDDQGEIQDKIGLCHFWVYKVDSDFVHKKQYSEYMGILDMAKSYFDAAISRNSVIGKYHNNVGCCLIQKYKISDRNDSSKSKYLSDAMTCFQKNAMIDVTSYKPWINMADIAIYQLKEKIGITSDMISFRTDTDFLNQVNQIRLSGDLGSFSRILSEAKEKLNRARFLNPLFINSYYKSAEVEMYSAVILDDNIGNVLEDVEELFKQAEEISPYSPGFLFVKRTYYDLVNNSQKMKLVNDEIRKFNKQDADAWDKLICSNMS